LNPVMRIIDTLRHGSAGQPSPVYSYENYHAVGDAIALLERLDVDEDGVLYIRSKEATGSVD